MTIAQKLMGTGTPALQALNFVGTVISSEAGAGSNQAGATALTLDDIHWIKTGGSNTGVLLPNVLGPGDSMEVFANTGNTLKVYPPGTGTINGGSASAAVSLTDKQKGIFTCLDGGTNANFTAVIS